MFHHTLVLLAFRDSTAFANEEIVKVVELDSVAQVVLQQDGILLSGGGVKVVKIGYA